MQQIRRLNDFIDAAIARIAAHTDAHSGAETHILSATPVRTGVAMGET